MIITSAWGNGGSGRYTLDCLDPDNLRNNIHHFHINIIFGITAYTFSYYCIINHSKRRFSHLDSTPKHHSFILLCKFDENSCTKKTKSCTCIYMYGYRWGHSVLIQHFFPFNIDAKCFKEKHITFDNSIVLLLLWICECHYYPVLFQFVKCMSRLLYCLRSIN